MQCPSCGGPESKMTGQEYDSGPHRYDGISVYHCPCGVRIGSWTGFELLEGEPEFIFGGGERYWRSEDAQIFHVWRKISATARRDCPHIWRVRVRFTAAWKHVCIGCGAKAR